MPRLVVIDDRAEVRRLLADVIRRLIPKDSAWEVYERGPLLQKEDYKSWLAENDDVAVLVLDENLHEQTDDARTEAVDYDGHDVVAQIRGSFPDFPIFIVTSVSVDNDDLRKAAPDVENIIERNKFLSDAKTHVNRILRAAVRFEEAMREQLGKLDTLSHKAATGEASRDELRQLNELRTKFALPFTHSNRENEIAELLPQAEALIAEARSLVKKIISEPT